MVGKNRNPFFEISCFYFIRLLQQVMPTGTVAGCRLIVACHLFTVGGVVFADPCVAVACLICSCGISCLSC